MPDVSHPTQEPPQLPSQGVRTLVSLLLFLHLFSLGVVFMSYGNPLGIEEQESLNRRLLDVLSPYVETFNLNLGHRYRVPTPPETAVEPTARYYLTHGKPTDVDFVVEIDARKKDGTAEKVTIPPSNLWPHQRYLRYQMLANAIGSLSGNDLMADNEGVELILPKAVAGGVLAEMGATRGTIRCRSHLMLRPQEVASTNSEVRDPFDSRYYSTVFDAQVLVSGGRVDLMKSNPAGEVAPVERNRSMFEVIAAYFRTLCDRFGEGWNRFWFTPSDLCILGPIRFLTGLVVLYLHATLSPDLVRFFGAGGWIPLDTLRELNGGTLPLSYLNYLSTPGELWTAQAIAAVVLLLFTLGLFTRITSILSLVVLVSEVHRGPMLTSQVEPIATFLLLYLCIGPAGACFSLDALLRRRKQADPQSLLHPASGLSFTATLAVRLMQVHVAIVYGLMGLSQLTVDTWWIGLGTWWLVARADSRLIDLTWLNPSLIQLWNYAQLLFEFTFALLIWNRLARPLLLAIGVFMWPLLALATGFGTFAVMMLIANLAFVPSSALRACWAGCSRKSPETISLTPARRS